VDARLLAQLRADTVGDCSAACAREKGCDYFGFSAARARQALSSCELVHRCSDGHDAASPIGLTSHSWYALDRTNLNEPRLGTHEPERHQRERHASHHSANERNQTRHEPQDDEPQRREAQHRKSQHHESEGHAQERNDTRNVARNGTRGVAQGGAEGGASNDTRRERNAHADTPRRERDGRARTREERRGGGGSDSGTDGALEARTDDEAPSAAGGAEELPSVSWDEEPSRADLSTELVPEPSTDVVVAQPKWSVCPRACERAARRAASPAPSASRARPHRAQSSCARGCAIAR
jgi:hypothetical protein